MNNIYHCLIFEQNDFFKNQTIEELLRERANYYIEKNRKNDFWILIEPDFLKNDSLNNLLSETNYLLNKKNKYKTDSNVNTLIPLCVLISTDFEFIKWIKLRIGYFETLDNLLSDLKLKSDGIYITLENKNTKTILKDNPISLSPNILVEQFKMLSFK